MLRTTALVSLFCFSATAGELDEVKMPDAVTVEGKQLKLNGMGVRTKGVNKVYVAGLYLEKASADPTAILAADGVRKLDITARRDMPNAKVVEAIDEALTKNAPEKAPALKDRLAKLYEAIPDTKKGETMSITYLPGKGTTVSLNGAPRGTFEGKDLADAVFLCWLGKSPLDEGLKKGLLSAK